MGLLTGGVYALLALGFTLIFSVARILNFAHTGLYMVAAYIVFTFSARLGLNVGLAFVISILATGIMGVFIYQALLDRIREHETAVVIICISLANISQQVMLLIFGGRHYGIPDFVPGYVEMLGIKILNQYLITLAAVVVLLFGMWALISKTKVGIAIRCTAQEREAANLVGINVGRQCMLAMAIAAGLAAVAGGLVTPIYSVHPFMWLEPLITILAITVLGGLGSIKGSVVAAFILGLVGTAVAFLLPAGAFLKTIICLLVMVGVLLTRPEGLWGVAFEEERL